MTMWRSLNEEHSENKSLTTTIFFALASSGIVYTLFQVRFKAVSADIIVFM